MYNSVTSLFFLLSFLIPAFICCLYLLFSYSKKESKREKLIKQILLLYFGLNIVFVLFTGLRDSGMVRFGGKEYPFMILYFSITSVAFYNFIFLLTNKEQKVKINTLHYALPIILSAITIFFFYILYPRIKSLKELNTFMIPYSTVYYVLYQLFYTSLSARYTLSYKKEIQKINKNKSVLANNNVSWLYYVIAMKLCFLLFLSIQVILGKNYPVLYPLLYILSFASFAVIIFNILERNYYFLPPLQVNTVLTATGHIFSEPHRTSIDVITRKNIIISQSEIENYFRKQKPYLQATFKVDDLATAFGTNRTYMSKFINNTYNINFNQFVNQWRINEMKEISLLKENQDKSIEELSQMAGFGNVRSYWRAIKTQS